MDENTIVEINIEEQRELYSHEVVTEDGWTASDLMDFEEYMSYQDTRVDKPKQG